MTKSNEAYGLLADMIEVGTLAPGSVLTEGGLAEMVGIGRTPLREAVQRLDRDHLVIRSARGIEIPAISVDDQLARLEVRRSLEALAVTLACTRASAAHLSAIDELVGEMESTHELEPYMVVVRKTHALLCNSVDNEYLASSMTPLHGLSRRFWMAHIVDPAREVAEGKELHLAALRALVGRDPQAARAAILTLNDYLVESALAVASRRARIARDAPVTT